MRRWPVFADPQTNFTVHRIFGTEKHKNAPLGFLNDILALEGDQHITDITYRDPAPHRKPERGRKIGSFAY